MLISIVRDPPGGGSFASYENAESTVVINTGRYDVFDGVSEEGGYDLGAKSDNDVCIGFLGESFLLLDPKFPIGNILSST
jgi:hypothetical protein